MIRAFKHHLPTNTLLEVLADSALSFIAVVLAVSFQTLPDQSAHHPAAGFYGLLPVAIAFAALMAALYALVGVYKRHNVTSLNSLLGRTLLAIALGGPIAYMMFGVLPEGERVRETAGYLLVYLVGGLLLMRPALYSARRGDIGSKRVLVIGAGSSAREIEAGSALFRSSGFVVAGFLSTDNNAIEVNRANLLADHIDLRDLVHLTKADELVVAVDDENQHGLPMQALLDCRVKGVPVMDLANFYERALGEVPVAHVKPNWFVYGAGFAQNSIRTFTKRLFDIAVSAGLLALTWPIMIVTAIAIRIESTGPLIIRQERVGLGGQSFTCLKFRSMRADAEKDGVARWAVERDSRITRIGRFIRKTRIDELPQLFNVLGGSMSLIGPRPERPSFVADLKRQIPYYDLRHSVKPGLTGWAQVRFSYSSTLEDTRRKLQFDLYYVKNHSFFLDCLILFETVRVILFCEGAR